MGLWTTRWWVVTRLVAIAVFMLHESYARMDVWYFSQSLDQLHEQGLGGTLREYPLPAVAIIALPWLVAKAVGIAHAYVRLFALVALATDAAFTLILSRSGTDRTGVAVWIAGVPLLGGMSYFRFDLLPAVLAGAAVLLLASRPRVAMFCISVATAVKLWPALVIPPLIARVRDRWQAAGVVLLTGGVLAGLTVVLAGWARLVSPLTYEGDRGLQIESVWATPAMALWSRSLTGYSTGMQYHSAAVTGPWVPALITASSFGLLVLAIALIACWWRLLARPEHITSERLIWVALAAVSGFLVLGKVLSPQYLIWVLAIAAAGLAVTGGGNRALKRWTIILVGAAGLTQLIFPITYGGLMAHNGYTVWAVTFLVIRNGTLLYLLGISWVQAWRNDVPQLHEVAGVTAPAAA